MRVGRANIEAVMKRQAAMNVARNAARRAANMVALCTPARTLHTATMDGATTGAKPKTEPWRCPALLDMADGRPCLLCPPCTCRCTPGSVVACHSNLSIHGKAGARKADDCYSAWGGDRAHEWLDRSGAPAAEKEAAFMAAHLRQVLAWRQVAADPTEPARFRNAARAALVRLNATLA